MLSQLVQEMRVGSHIPYRKSELGRPSGCPRPGMCGQRQFPRTIVRGWKK